MVNKLWLSLLIVAAALSCRSTPSETQSSAMAMQSNTSELLGPRDKARRLLEEGIAGANVAVVRDLLAPTYRQHNPRLKDGPEGLIGYVEWLATAPASERPAIKVRRAFVDHEFVFLHSEYIRHGTRVAAFDVFRVENRKLAEHWDAGQPIPEKSVGDNDMLDGPDVPADLIRTRANKRLVRRFAQEVMVKGKLRNLAKLVSEDYVQHNPQAKDGLDDLRATRTGLKGATVEIKRVLGEGNFVLVHSKRTVDGEAFAVFDLFRVDGGKIVEHWDVIEAVAAHSENDNGMF